jgi:leader peptidase (prepilin peptidase)/N-methyltransferase
VIQVIAGAFGFLGALAAHDLAIQSLRELPLRPFAGTCRRCGHARGWLTVSCPVCTRRIGREIPLALLGALVGVAFAIAIGADWALIPYLGFLTLTIALGVTDLDDFRIVDRLNLRGTLALAVTLGLASIADGALPAMGRGLLGALAYFAGSNLVFLLAGGRGFGYGDVKLSAQLGLFTAYLSWGTLGWAVMITAVLGAVLSLGVLGVGMVARSRARRSDAGEGSTVKEVMQTELPYGPAMILGAWISITLAGLGAFPIPT